MPDRDEAAGPIGIGEVYRRLVAMEGRLDTRLDKLVSNDRYTAEQKAQDDRMKELAIELGEIRAGNRRAFYTALSALVFPLLFTLLTIYLTGGPK
jgi:hypothetical protein